jgi:DNA-nicking Smr family endonuclease
VTWFRSLLRWAFSSASSEVDLHGLRVTDALTVVEAALREAEAQKLGTLRIVCGKGRGSKGGLGVLRAAVPGWLDANGYSGSYRRQVDRDGRDGAILVEIGRTIESPPEGG